MKFVRKKKKLESTRLRCIIASVRLNHPQLQKAVSFPKMYLDRKVCRWKEYLMESRLCSEKYTVFPVVLWFNMFGFKRTASIESSFNSAP